MNQTWLAACGTVVLLVGVGLVWSAENADATAVIDKAIKAHGGADKLNKYPAILLKGKGTFYPDGKQKVPFKGEWAIQGATQLKESVDVTDKDDKGKETTSHRIEVVSGDKGWLKLDDKETRELPKEAIAEEREGMYAGWVSSTLTPLKDKAFKLSLLAEVQVQGKPAIGIKIESKDHRDISLYFDKESGLLVKSAYPVKDVNAKETEPPGKPLTQEVFYSAYKTFNGLPQATRVEVQRNGKPFVETEYTDVEPREKLEDSIFARP